MPDDAIIADQYQDLDLVRQSIAATLCAHSGIRNPTIYTAMGDINSRCNSLNLINLLIIIGMKKFITCKQGIHRCLFRLQNDQ